MLQQNPYGASAYRAIGIETGVAAADPLGLVVMLYDGAIHAIVRAEGHLAAGAVEPRGLYTSKAIGIVTQGLLASLDRRVGGPLAESLGALYEYMGRRLFAANLRGDSAIYVEVRTLLTDLRSSWATLRASRLAVDAAGRPLAYAEGDTRLTSARSVVA
jgi:flagellar secretion chaperone FliS